jgi:hypothetical protein
MFSLKFKEKGTFFVGRSVLWTEVAGGPGCTFLLGHVCDQYTTLEEWFIMYILYLIFCKH